MTTAKKSAPAAAPAVPKRKTIRDLYKPHLSDHDAAMSALTLLKVVEPGLSLLMPVVIRDVQLSRRIEVHAAETNTGPAPKKGETKTSPLLRAELLAETFALGDGRRVRWGEATEQDHQDRIDFLTRQILGTQQTIGRHAAAIALLQAKDATCLDEIARIEATEEAA